MRTAVLRSVGRKNRMKVMSGLRLPRPPRHRPPDHWTAGREPLLEDLLTDPLVGLVMRRDGIDAETTRAVMETARQALVSP